MRSAAHGREETRLLKDGDAGALRSPGVGKYGANERYLTVSLTALPVLSALFFVACPTSFTVLLAPCPMSLPALP